MDLVFGFPDLVSVVLGISVDLLAVDLANVELVSISLDAMDLTLWIWPP